MGDFLGPTRAREGASRPGRPAAAVPAAHPRPRGGECLFIIQLPNGVGPPAPARGRVFGWKRRGRVDRPTRAREGARGSGCTEKGSVCGD